MTLPVWLRTTHPGRFAVPRRAFSLTWLQRAEVWWHRSVSRVPRVPPLEQPGVLGGSFLGLPTLESCWAFSLCSFHAPVGTPHCTLRLCPPAAASCWSIAPGAGIPPASPPSPRCLLLRGGPCPPGRPPRLHPRPRLPVPHHSRDFLILLNSLSWHRTPMGNQGVCAHYSPNWTPLARAPGARRLLDSAAPALFPGPGEKQEEPRSPVPASPPWPLCAGHQSGRFLCVWVCYLLAGGGPRASPKASITGPLVFSADPFALPIPGGGVTPPSLQRPGVSLLFPCR